MDLKLTSLLIESCYIQFIKVSYFPSFYSQKLFFEEKNLGQDRTYRFYFPNSKDTEFRFLETHLNFLFLFYFKLDISQHTNYYLNTISLFMSGDFIKEEDFGLSVYGHISLQNCQLEPPKSQLGNEQKNSKRGRPRKKPWAKKQSDVPKNSGHWSAEQKKRYHWFLEIYNNHFLNKHLRRTDKIFKTMQSFVGTREAEQCRSHHQKIEKKFKEFHKILLHYRNEHYGTEEHMAVEEDLLNHGIGVFGPLVRKEELYMLQSTVKKQYHSVGQYIQLKEESKAENMLSDRYEMLMDFNNFIAERYYYFKQQ